MVPRRIPVTAIVCTKNEEVALSRCLSALRDFDEVLVVDSGSVDKTVPIARRWGAKIVPFAWDGRYPKKRQWCLDKLALRNEWVLFVDADEVVTVGLAREIALIFHFGPECAGYFVEGLYVWQGRVLHHGLRNAKLGLFDRRRIAFPLVNDLDLPGMGEIEGHYQPVLKDAYCSDGIGRLENPMLHYAAPDRESWERRHERYAAWEAGMNARGAWPEDPIVWRQTLKRLFRALPLRPLAAFLHSYVFKRGFLDGRAGLDFAMARARYYRLIGRQTKTARSTTGKAGLWHRTAAANTNRAQPAAEKASRTA